MQHTAQLGRQCDSRPLRVLRFRFGQGGAPLHRFLEVQAHGIGTQRLQVSFQVFAAQCLGLRACPVQERKGLGLLSSTDQSILLIEDEYLLLVPLDGTYA